MMKNLGKSVVAKLLPSENKKAAQAAAQAIAELELHDKRDILKLFKTFRYGFPYEPTSIAFDTLQHILAIGTKNGYVKLYGGKFIETTISHANLSAVLFMEFVINEGVLITYCEDTTLSLWNLRQKQPAVSNSKKLINEKASAIYLPFRNKWLYLGTEKGNIYILNIYSQFSQSGYDIKWNNIIELSQKTHPGKVIHLSDHPLDNTKLLIGFETGLIVLWNVKSKKAELRFNSLNDAPLCSISWFFDGKRIIASHSNGNLITWACKAETKPISITCPHYDETDLIRSYNPIPKLNWETTKTGEPLIVFSNGLSQQSNMKDAITIIKNKNKTVLEMKSKIVDFIVVRTQVWQTEEPVEASAIIVLLEDNLVTIDIKSEGFPIFEHHHSIGLHESPITFIDYIVDPDLRIIHNLMVSKEKQAKQNSSSELPVYSSLPYPVSGGIQSTKANLFPYHELIVTGHEDGTIKLWESSGICLDQIYKIKTHKIFDKRRIENTNNSIEIEHPYKITNVSINSSYMAVAGAGGHVTLYKYISKKSNQVNDELTEIAQIEIPINYDYSNDKTHGDNALNLDHNSKKDLKSLLRVKIGYRQQQGYQPELVCLLLWSHKPPVINSLVINTKYSILIIGTDESIICVDFTSNILLLNISIVDYYGNQDPFERTPKSPKKPKNITDVFFNTDDFNSADNSNNALHFLARQFTLDNNHFNNLQRTMDATLRDNSKSPSCSSLDSLARSEGVSFVAFNESIVSLKHDQVINTVWLGTTYGTVIILNINCAINEFLKDNNNNANNTLNNTTTNTTTTTNNCNLNAINNASSTPISNVNSGDTKIITLVPTGSKHFLKGQILYIGFLDNLGNLIMPKTYSQNAIPQAIHTNQSSTSLFDKVNTNNNNNVNGVNNSNCNNNNNNNSNSLSSNNTSNNLNNVNTNISNNNDLSNNVNSGVSADDSKIGKSHKKPLMITRSARVESISESINQIQYAVLCSDKQIKVISLPSQNCSFKYAFEDSATVTKATVTVINGYSYLLCLLENGDLKTFNLPSLKPNSNLTLSLNFREQEISEKLTRTFTFGSKGHFVYMSTPSELQKGVISILNNDNLNITEMLPELFNPKILTPEVPKPSLFKTIFSSTPLDRELLFGEASGKPSQQIVKANPLEIETARANKEMSELQKLALQRGEKLGQLDQRTQEMTMQASALAKNANELANKYKKKNHWFS